MIVNEIRLLGEDFLDSRVVEKVLVTLPERFEYKISSLEESKDLSKISLAKLMNALQAQEQRRAMRQNKVIESAFQAQNKFPTKSKKNFYKCNKEGSNSQESSNQRKYPHCKHCKKSTYLEKYCWWRLDAICGNCK